MIPYVEEQVGKYFKRYEFSCRGSDCCGHSAPVDKRLLDALDDLRERAGVPLRINSGFRCRVHNKKIGGADTSQHARGLAADVGLPRDMTIEELATHAEHVPAFEQGGIGLYPTFIHVDVRGKKARWDNR